MLGNQPISNLRSYHLLEEYQYGEEMAKVS